MPSQVRTIKQANLTGECWMVQFMGEKACKSCEYKGTKECGGKKIRKTGKNEKGIDVPLT